MTRTIKIGEHIAIVDGENYDRLAGRNWRILGRDKPWKYATTGHSTFMHHIVYGKKIQLDHINGNGLDNRKENLRPADNQQNQANSRKSRKNCHSRYKGVSFRADTKKWVAYIKINGRQLHLGSFDNEPDAAKAYDEAARRYFGEYARTNY